MTKKIKTYQELPATFGQIEKAIWKNSDDLAVAIARSFERLEENMQATEVRLLTRLAEIESKILDND